MNKDRLAFYQAEITEALQQPPLGLIPADSAHSSRKLSAIAKELQKEQPFLYSFVRDTLNAAAKNPDNAELHKQYAEAIRVRLESFSHWSQDGNETIAAIESGKIDADSIKPHIRLEAAAYDEMYSNQSDRIALRAARISASAVKNKDANHINLPLSPNINHSFRWTHAISLVENLLGIISALDPSYHAGDETARWMDIGCGTGLFANAVNPARFDLKKWEIVGCDFQAGKIAVAEARKARGRRFFASDAFEMLKTYENRGETFDLVSMFEFLEHLEDPLKFIRQLQLFRPKFLLAASPLAQKLTAPKDDKPDRAHLWSFSRRSWEQMFKEAGFQVVYSSEVRVGTYIGGLDWLSIVCGPQEELRKKRQNIR